MTTWTAYLRDKHVSVTSAELKKLKVIVDDADLRSRMSECLWFDILVHHFEFGIDPEDIVNSIRNVEAGEPHSGIKPASEFRNKPLKGLWHKHYFTARFLAHNISLALGSSGLEKAVNRVLDPQKYPTITPEAIAELVPSITNEPVEKREADGKLTGEWIIFARHAGKNYYLGLAIHNADDQRIYDHVVEQSLRDFPELKSWLPS